MIYTLTLAKIAITNYGQINGKDVAQLQSLCSTFTKKARYTTVRQRPKKRIE